MRRALHQEPVHRRNLPHRSGFNQAPRRLDDPAIRVDLSEAVPSGLAAQRSQQVTLGRSQDHHTRALKFRRPGTFDVAMQTANALQQHVHWAEIGDQQIRIEIERCFQCLCAHNYSRRPGALLAENSLDRCVQQQAIRSTEPPMMERGDPANPE